MSRPTITTSDPYAKLSREQLIAALKAADALILAEVNYNEPLSWPDDMTEAEQAEVARLESALTEAQEAYRKALNP